MLHSLKRDSPSQGRAARSNIIKGSVIMVHSHYHAIQYRTKRFVQRCINTTATLSFCVKAFCTKTIHILIRSWICAINVRTGHCALLMWSEWVTREWVTHEWHLNEWYVASVQLYQRWVELTFTLGKRDLVRNNDGSPISLLFVCKYDTHVKKNHCIAMKYCSTKQCFIW